MKSNMEITFQIDNSFVAGIDPELIQKAVLTTVHLFNKSRSTAGNLTLTITNNKTVQQLNHRYRGIDAPTDVLSFENKPDPDFPNIDPAMTDYLGDIIIAYPVAKAQATASGHSPLDEVILLAVHGTLHLLGFNHHTPKHKEKMWIAQHQVMVNLGLTHIHPTEN